MILPACVTGHYLVKSERRWTRDAQALLYLSNTPCFSVVSYILLPSRAGLKLPWTLIRNAPGLNRSEYRSTIHSKSSCFDFGPYRPPDQSTRCTSWSRPNATRHPSRPRACGREPRTKGPAPPRSQSPGSTRRALGRVRTHQHLMAPTVHDVAAHDEPKIWHPENRGVPGVGTAALDGLEASFALQEKRLVVFGERLRYDERLDDLFGKIKRPRLD